MAPREKSRTKSSKAIIEEYALLIDGAPLTCRWQELKDFIREYAPHNRQAEMYEDENGKPTGQASVIVRGLEEAQRAYRALSRRGWDGHCITVALAKRVNGGALDTIEGPTTSPNLTTRMPNSAAHTSPLRHTPAVSPPISPRSNRYTGYSSAADPHTAYYAATGTYQQILVAPHRVDGPNVMTLPYHTVAVSPTYTQYQDAHYIDVNNAAHYYQNVAYSTAALAYTNGHHVTAPNVSQHTASRPRASGSPDAPIVSPNRTVFLTKLPYSAVGQAVRRLLENYGRVERCDVPPDRTSPNKIQGTAVAKFHASEDAARAINDLNGSIWKGVTISARWDRDSAITSSAGSTSRRPAQARHSSSSSSSTTTTTSSSSRAGRATDANRDDNGARDHRGRPSQGPLIVNGSRGHVAPSRSRRGSKQDDSDSSDDDDDDEEEKEEEEEDGEDDISSDGKSALLLYAILADFLTEDAGPVVRCSSGRRH